MRAALATTPGVYNLRVPGQESSKSPIVKSVGQIIQYTGNAKPEEVIAILNNQNSFMRARSADDTAIKPFIAFDPTTNPLMRLLEPKPEQRRKEVKVPTLKYGYYLWGLHKEQEVEPPLLFKLEGEAKLQPWFDEFGSGIGTPSILTGPTPR